MGLSTGCGPTSSLLWNLVVDEIVTLLNNTQGYADDLAILKRGNHLEIISEQKFLKLVEE